MRQAGVTQHTILLLVECHTIEEFREALLRMPIRKVFEWRSLDDGHLGLRPLRSAVVTSPVPLGHESMLNRRPPGGKTP